MAPTWAGSWAGAGVSRAFGSAQSHAVRNFGRCPLVKIRLKRMGAKKRPFYRLVVAEARSPRDGRFIEQVGYYDPLTEPATVKIDEEKVMKWLSTGAQPSDAARVLLKREGILERHAARKSAVKA